MRSPFRAPLAAALAIAAGGFVATSMVRAQQPIPVTVPPVTTLASSGVAPATSNSGATVNEAPPSVLPPPGRLIDGWGALWGELGKSSIDLRIALAEMERAEAGTRIAWGAALPSVTGTVSLTHIPGGGTGAGGFFPPGNILQAQLAVTAPLINLRAWHAIATSRELEEIAKLSLLDVRRRVSLALARAAVGIASAQRLAELNRIGLQAALERLSLTRKRLAAGVGDARDLVRAQQDVAASRAVIPASDEALIEAQEGLATILSSPMGVGMGGDPDALEREVLSFCGEAASSKERIDVTLAKKQIEIAKRNVDDIALKFVPTLTAQLSTTASGAAFSGPFVTGWSLSGVLTIPFYDGGVRYGELRDRKALVEEARAKEVATEVGVLVEVAQARRAIDVAVEAQTSAREARDLAREADRLARLAYAAGIGTNFDLIDAGRTLRSAETQLVLRDLDLSRARISLPFVEGRCTGVKGTN